MKRYAGKRLFPDPNQIYRIRKVVLSIIEENNQIYNKKLGFEDVTEIVNEALKDKGWYEDEITTTTISRLSRFGKTEDSNSLKLLESLPLLHVISKRFTEEDLMRVALGQPLSEEANTTTLYRNQVNELKQRIIDSLAYLDQLTNTNAIQLTDSVSLTSEDKRYIFNMLVSYGGNATLLREMGILDVSLLDQYESGDIDESLIISMLAVCEIPGTVIVLLQKKEPSLRLDPNMGEVQLDDIF